MNKYLFNNYYKLIDDSFTKIYYGNTKIIFSKNEKQIYSDNFIKNLLSLYKIFL